ncbi:MAG: glycine--tRNA ligase subunit beta [bacterium]|jgi:glycyl-tRNA synthetase beta chain
MSVPFLLEIGTEEIPDWMIEPALADLKQRFETLLAASQLADGASVRADATPRRLVLRADAIAERQPDTEELVSGPPKAAAFKDGQPTGAAIGFARKFGAEVSALETIETPRGEYVAFRRKVEGRTALDILAEALPELILKTPWPKTMYWAGKNGPRFIRPIRWLVALLGESVVPFEIAGVRSGRESSGHRQLGAARFPVGTADYEARLRENGVILTAAERRSMIETGIARILAGKPLRVKQDAALVEMLANITEQPAPILGGFDAEYLKLPEEVLITVMRHHQKYFAVEDEQGRLAPHFIAVMNTSGDPEGLVRHGNERVLRARFNDARFFWSVDLKKPLADRVADLAHVTFQAKLGSYLEKTKRNVRLAKKLARMARVDEAAVERAALLAKCDLTTDMVKELTELQGIMGGLYAREQGEPEPVWRAIYDQYKPESMDDAIPSTPEGRIVALADKLDTLQGCFRVGLIPSGSKDPFALRRAAQGVVKILVEGGLALPVDKLLGGDAQLSEFFLDRVRYYFREIRGYKYDEVNAVLAAGCGDLTDVDSRLAAIAQVRTTADFEPLAASFKRIKNILRQAEFEGGGEVDAALLEAGPEAELYAAFAKLRRRVNGLRRKKDYRPALEAIASIRPQVDAFFDKVLVNAPDPVVRRNRLTMLHKLLSEFSAIADFSEIVTTQ